MLHADLDSGLAMTYDSGAGQGCLAVRVSTHILLCLFDKYRNSSLLWDEWSMTSFSNRGIISFISPDR